MSKRINKTDRIYRNKIALLLFHDFSCVELKLFSFRKVADKWSKRTQTYYNRSFRPNAFSVQQTIGT